MIKNIKLKIIKLVIGKKVKKVLGSEKIHI